MQLEEQTFGQILNFCPNCRFPLKLVKDQYQFIRKLGSGGFGAVYLVKNIKLGIERAIKVLRSDNLAPELLQSLRKRFEREMQITAILSEASEHIVRIDDAGEDANIGLFYVMEYLRGESIEQILQKNQRLDRVLIFHILEQLCDAIDCAHSHNVIHRDLKPSNIFVVKTSRNPCFVKVIDFGIARIVKETFQIHATQGMMGSPLYMSPEQWQNQEITPATDIYALGGLMYHMFTGFPPFTEQNLIVLMDAHLTAPLMPMSERCSSLDLEPRLEQIVKRALAKSPHERYSDIKSFRQAWRPFAPTSSEIDLCCVEAILPQTCTPHPSNNSPPAIQLQANDPALSPQEHSPYLLKTASQEAKRVAPQMPSVVSSGSINSASTVNIDRANHISRKVWFIGLLIACGLLVTGGYWVFIARQTKTRKHEQSGQAQMSIVDAGTDTSRPQQIISRHDSQMKGQVTLDAGTSTSPIRDPYPDKKPYVIKGQSDNRSVKPTTQKSRLSKSTSDKSSKLVVISQYTSPSPKPQPQVQQSKKIRSIGRLRGAREVYLSPGHFMRCDEGRHSGFRYKSTQKSRCAVVLTRGFWITQTEITQAQFKQIMGYNPAKFQACGSNCPVESVTWHEALTFCNALSIKSGLESCFECKGQNHNVTCTAKPAYQGTNYYRCRGYRLPTEAEWLYADMAGREFKRWANDHAGDAQRYAWTRANSYVKYDGCFVIGPSYWASGMDPRRKTRGCHGPNPVARKKANPWQIYDMRGNVSELCWDDWASYSSSSKPEDPVGYVNRYSVSHRGGHWEQFSLPGGNTDAKSRRYNIGFRIVRTNSPEVSPKRLKR
jgi:serine/threonine-protein kinase